MNIRRPGSWLLPIAFYAALTAYFLLERATLFLMLFGLWCELVIMLAFYQVLSIRDKKEGRGIKAFGVLGGAGPILILQFCIAAGLSLLLEEFTLEEGGDWPGLLKPLHAFGTPVIMTCASLVLIYGMLTRTLIREHLPISVVESGLLFQASLLAILGFVAIVLSMALWAFIAPGHAELLLAALAVIRMILQPRIRRAFEIPTVG